MLICGIKASHDGGIALIDGNTLLFSIEAEKLDNAPRYSPLRRLDQVAEILDSEGFAADAVDRFVIDGWAGDATRGVVELEVGGRMTRLPVAPYVDRAPREPLHRYEFGEVSFGGGLERPYSSYHHVANHILGSYCTSPFARRGEEALVVVWDGGMTARAYHVNPAVSRVRAVATLLPMIGNVFPDFCKNFGPFRGSARHAGPDEVRGHLEVAGKAMAYAALGTVTEPAQAALDSLFDMLTGDPDRDSPLLAEKAVANRDQLFPGLTDADIIANLQQFLGDQLLDALARLVRKHYPDSPPNLCLGGGCALNIKWNSAIRASGLFREVWVPPFPNDSGAAIGTACCELFRQTGAASLDWNVYSGPRLRGGEVPPGWTVEDCDETGLAAVLHTAGEPVVVLSGRAELGPRALGNRSIIAPAVDPRMKTLLNDVKGREHYRPVAPICLTSRAPEVFDPGTPDPYMLFEHRLRPDWADRVPAIAHLDGSARLQTVDPQTRSPIAKLLAAYESISGIPVLCNTSANLNGSGFFPDVATAARWGRTRRIWSEGKLYTNPHHTAAPTN